ncbi:hypothetical protein Enr13x_23390 [Stieleria neptunia]|uniref:Uncharacterized protein n=1 Tax=Stieleria neptunia TaxID=2527979 RepID=A0A518HNT8_9BACT|nr:hypothetical protein [Stieleria neptunia]QDV42491.1 hypothetical protein Enr13x_23390 [Stieleria neptunia]
MPNASLLNRIVILATTYALVTLFCGCGSEVAKPSSEPAEAVERLSSEKEELEAEYRKRQLHLLDVRLQLHTAREDFEQRADAAELLITEYLSKTMPLMSVEDEKIERLTDLKYRRATMAKLMQARDMRDELAIARVKAEMTAYSQNTAAKVHRSLDRDWVEALLRFRCEIMYLRQNHARRSGDPSESKRMGAEVDHMREELRERFGPSRGERRARY